MSICLDNQTTGSFIQKIAISLLTEYVFVVYLRLYIIKNVTKHSEYTL